jgi:cell division protein FtsL|tara:strand:- start:1353 stop:1775 length:423 start_codon:yes stop_codon:yes gene_type:complete
MNSEYSNNPLTEVALALSMAFFSIMVLSIFALSQKDNKTLVNEKISINATSSEKENKKKNRTIIFYFNNNFYDKNFKKWNLENHSKNYDGYTLAVPSEISVKKLFEIKNNLKKLDIKITQQNKEWNDALNNKLMKKGINK